MGVLHRKIPALWINGVHRHTPTFGGISKGCLQLHELRQIAVVEGVGLAQVAAGIELVEPHLAGGRALLEEQHHRFHPRPLEGAAGAVEHRVQVAVGEQLLPQGHRGVVGVGEKGVLDHHAGATAGPQQADEVLEKQKGSFAAADLEVLLHLLAFAAAERRVGEDHIEAVALLHIAEVLGEGIGVQHPGRLDAVEDHVHDRDHIGETLFLLAGEGAVLEGVEVCGAEFAVGGAAFAHVFEGFAQEAGGAHRRVVDRLSDLGVHHLHNGADQGPGRVVLTAVTAGVAHALDLFLIEHRELVLLGLGAEAQTIDHIDDFAQVVAAADFVAQFAEDLADLVFDRVRPAGALLEALQVGEQALVHEVAQVVAGEGGVMIQLAAGVLRCRPAVPAVALLEDGRIGAALQDGHGGLVVFEPVEVLEEQQPGGLLGVVELGAAAGLLAEAVVDRTERLLEGAGCRGGAGTVRSTGAGSAAGGLAIAGGLHRRLTRQGHRTAPTTAGHDQPAAQQIALHCLVAGFVPLQGFPQAAVAR